MASIAEIPVDRKVAISHLLAEGVVGWRRDALAQFQEYSILWNIRDLVYRLGGGKQHRKMLAFKELFPLIDAMYPEKKRSVFEQLKAMRKHYDRG